MSFANFDELTEICCGMAEVEVLRKARPMAERLDLMTNYMADPNRWWGEVAKEILKEKEREVLHV